MPLSPLVCDPGTLPASVSKDVVSAGWGPMPDYPTGTRVTFHFKTCVFDTEHVLDDTRTMEKPMELILGKQFKLEIWEPMIRTMKLGEQAKFTVPSTYSCSYPLVSRALRDAQRPREVVSHHCCGMMKGCGYQDLDRLMDKPTDLVFYFDVLRIEQPGEYEKESWQLTLEEKLASLPVLREEGNSLFKKGDVKGARAKYFEAIARLEQLALREQPGSADAKKLDDMKIPLLLNYVLCLMKAEDYYDALEHVTSVLRIEPENVKGLFRRAKIHASVGNFKEAKDDFARALALDSSLKKSVNDELEDIATQEKLKNVQDRKRYRRLFDDTLA